MKLSRHIGLWMLGSFVGLVLASAAIAQPVMETQEAPPPEPLTTAAPAPASEETAETAPIIPPPAMPTPAPVAAAPAAPAPAAAPDPATATAAEMAIMENAEKLDKISPDEEAKKEPPKEEKKADKGPSVNDILEGTAKGTQDGFLVVKKDYSEHDLDARLTTARLALSQGRYPAALELFNALYAQVPDDNRVLMGRAVSMQKMGHFAEAMTAYEEVLERDPKNLEALTNMLGILKNTDALAALEKLQQLQEIYPGNAEIAAQLGLVYGTAGDYQKALKYLDIADSLKTGNPDVLYNKAIVYDRMGNKHQAVELYRQVIAMSKDGVLDASFPLEAVKKRLTTIH